MACSLPGSSIHGIFQARVLEWVWQLPINLHADSLKKQIKLKSHYPDISRKKDKTHISKILNEKGEVTTDNEGIQRIIRDY